MNEVWKLKKADSEFSKEIRARDKICIRCKRRPSTECSHFYEKGVASVKVRFDPDNADGLCSYCHPLWEGRTPGYIQYKKKQLGEERYRELEIKSYRVDGSVKRTDAILELMRRLGKHE